MSEQSPLVGRTDQSILREVENGFPHVPPGSSVVLEPKVRRVILENIRHATSLRRSKMVDRIKTFRHHSTRALTLQNVLSFFHWDIRQLYKRALWTELLVDAGLRSNSTLRDLTVFRRFLVRGLLPCTSSSYLKFVQTLAEKSSTQPMDHGEGLWRMLYYDFFDDAPGGLKHAQRRILKVLEDSDLRNEVIEFIDVQLNRLDAPERLIELPFDCPLKLHARYTRSQILAGLDISTWNQPSSNREGVAINKELNVEALFVTLQKSTDIFSPTTMYEDFALSDVLFHWQSQNSTAPNTPKGRSYIQHKALGKTILLFVREQSTDEHGHTMSYVFLGDASLQNWSGAKPMSIEWKLNEPIPAYILNASKKLDTD